MSKNKYQKLLNQISELRKSELSSFWDHQKFIKSTLFHQIAVSAAIHYKQHSDSTFIAQLLDFTDLKGTDFLKAVRWFEYRTGQSFVIMNKKLKKSSVNTITEENYQVFSEFIKTYKGHLPEIKSDEEYEEESEQKVKKLGKDPHDEFDLIDREPMRIGGRTVYGGYGTGKRK